MEGWKERKWYRQTKSESTRLDDTGNGWRRTYEDLKELAMDRKQWRTWNLGPV
jgi:hypothetical protein